MPRGEKGKKFVKGNPGGPGRPPIPPELKELRTMNRQEVEEVVNKYWMMDETAAEYLLQDKTMPMRDKMVLRAVRKAAINGDTSMITYFTDFIFGERPKHIKFSGGIINANGDMSKSDTLAALKKLNEEF